MQGGEVDMLIFQRHLPHVIANSMQASCALSHSYIEGSISLSTCKFEVAADDNTEASKADLVSLS